MKFFCDRCNAKYSISDEKVRGKVVKVRCKRCDNVITVSEEKNQAHDSIPEAESGAGGTGSRAGDRGEWYYSVEGQTFGPLEKDRLVEKYNSGELSANSYLWKESFSDWKPATDVEPFSTLLDEQAEDAGLSRPKRSTMDAGDSIEAVETSKDSSRSLSGGLGGSNAGSGGSGGRRDSTSGGSRSSSGSLPSVSEGKRSSEEESPERSRPRAESGSASRSSRDSQEDGGRSSRSSGGLGRERSRPEDRSSGRDRSRRRNSGDSERSSSEDRRERLERLRGKLKSNFDPDSEAEDDGASSGSLGRGESTAPSSDPDGGRSAAAAGGDQGGGPVGAAASSSAAAVDASAAEREPARNEAPAAAGAPQSAGGEVSEAIAEIQEPAEKEKTVDIDRDELEELEGVGDATREVDVEGLGEDPGAEFGVEQQEEEIEELDLDDLDPVESPEAEEPPAEAEEDDFSLPPAGSSRLEADKQEADAPSAQAPAPDLPGPEDTDDTHPDLFEEADEQDDKAALPTAPKLGDDEEESSDQADGMTQSLLMQLDKIEDEGSTVRYAGAAAAVFLVALGGVVGYIALAGPDEKEQPKKEEPDPEQVAMQEDEDDGPVQKTYSEDKIMALSPQKVEKGEGKGSEGSGEEGAAKGGGSESDDGLVEGKSLTESEGPTMDEAMEGARKRSDDDNSAGDLREMEGSGEVAKAGGGSDESESESGSGSRDFEAMQAVEGSSPGVENPTEAARNRGSSGGGMPLSKDQIRQGIKSVRESVATCRRRHARRGTPMDVGKIYVTLTIEPSGNVSGYSISPDKLEGVVFERCLSSHKGRWNFGPFDGSSQKLKAPFIMQ